MNHRSEKSEPLFLTAVEIKTIREALEQNLPQTLFISLDMGRNRRKILLHSPEYFEVESNKIALPDFLFGKKEERTIFIYRQGEWRKWQRFDPSTRKFYKMVFTAPARPPTIEIGGIKMHVTKGADPSQDTRNKIDTFGKLSGTVLDTCLGLGYTAIACARRKQVEKVLVCEADPNVYHFCRENPWSQSLFGNDKIQVVLMPAQELVSRAPDSYFTAIVHDPPRFALAPELYSENFYHEVFRVLKRGGELYHYTGNPNQRVRKKALLIHTRELLNRTGFRQVKQAYFGVVARK